MKKFLLKVLLFFALVVVMDFAFGSVFSWLRGHAKGGSTANCEYIANRCEDDIIILGSSRATHHYAPQIIEDSLGLSSYNCGEEGNGIVLAYGRFKMLTNRYKPKLIIYDMHPGYDYGFVDPNIKYLGYLRPYYNKKGIKPLFDSFDDELSILKMQSKMYQNTGKLLPNLVDSYIFRDNIKGYAPLYGKIKANINDLPKEGRINEIDSIKFSYVEKLIVESKEKNIPIVFMVSPRLGVDSDTTIYETEIDLCKKYSVPYYDFLNYGPIVTNTNYFQDIGHMNGEGATIYTNLIISIIRNNIDNTFE